MKSTDTPALAVFRPDSRNGYEDFQMRRDVADDLFRRGEIWGDATNGGFMPASGKESQRNPSGFRAKHEYVAQKTRKAGRRLSP